MSLLVLHKIFLLITLYFTMALGALLPGPDMLIVIRHSLRFGRTRGIATAFGVATLMTTYSAIAIFFIASIRARYMFAFRILASVGALYLLYLAYQCWRNAKEFRFGNLQYGGEEKIGLLRAYLTGAATNLSNPKAVIYFLSIMPFFIGQTQSLAFHLVIVVAVFIAVSSTFTFVATMMSLQKVRDLFSRMSAYMEYVFAVVLFIFAIWVLVENIFFTK